MSSRKTPYRGQARFIELGSMGAPFRSLINVDHISNVRFEQKIGQQDAVYDDAGEMTAPPQQFHEGWQIIIVIGHGAGGQNIFLPEEAQAISLYNHILDMIGGVGAPMSRMPKLKPLPPLPPVPAGIVGADGAPIVNSEDLVPPPLTDEEMEQLEHPEIYTDAVADAIDEGLGADVDGVAQTEPGDDAPTG